MRGPGSLNRRKKGTGTFDVYIVSRLSHSGIAEKNKGAGIPLGRLAETKPSSRERKQQHEKKR